MIPNAPACMIDSMYGPSTSCLLANTSSSDDIIQILDQKFESTSKDMSQVKNVIVDINELKGQF